MMAVTAPSARGVVVSTFGFRGFGVDLAYGLTIAAPDGSYRLRPLPVDQIDAAERCEQAIRADPR